MQAKKMFWKKVASEVWFVQGPVLKNNGCRKVEKAESPNDECLHEHAHQASSVDNSIAELKDMFCEGLSSNRSTEGTVEELKIEIEKQRRKIQE